MPYPGINEDLQETASIEVRESYLVLLLGIVMAIMVIVTPVVLWLKREPFLYVLIPLFALFFGACSVWIVRLGRRACVRCLERLREVSRLLNSLEPRAMSMRILGFPVTSKGGTAARLVPADDPSGTPIWAKVGMIKHQWKMPRPGVYDVLVYRDPDTEEDDLFVIRDGERVYGAKRLQIRSADEMVQERRENIKVGIILLCIIFALCIGFFGVLCVRAHGQLTEARESLLWPQADGVVMASVVDRTRVSKGKKSKRAYDAHVAYTYQVDGASYSGTRVHFSYKPFVERDDARALCRKYPSGAQIAVYYNPTQPDRAVLEPGHTEEPYKEYRDTLVITGVIVGFWGLLVIVLYFSIRKSIQQAGGLRQYRECQGGGE